MKLDQNYLSEEELEALIADIEKHDLVQAPPDLLNQILYTIEKSEPHIVSLENSSKTCNTTSLLDNNLCYIQKKKTVEFRRYCFQVITSVAAAIVLVFLLPTSMQMQKSELLSIPSKDIILAKQMVKTKSDVVENYNKEKTKTEHIFKSIEWFNIFE